MFDPFEYLSLRHRDGLLKTDFKTELGRVSYHVPCHLRVQNMGLRTQELLNLVPGTEVNTVERCSGHDGTWGVKTEFFAQSDEDRAAGIQGHGRRHAALRELRLPDCRAPHPAGDRRRGRRAEGASAYVAAPGVRALSCL